MASSSPLPWFFGAVGVGAVAIAASRAPYDPGSRGSRAILSAKDHAVLQRMLDVQPKTFEDRVGSRSHASSSGRHGSRMTLSELQALSRAAQAAKQSTPAITQQPTAQQQGRLVGTTRVKVNEGAMWRLAAEKMYGDYVDVPVVATREALQNSWDAIEEAVHTGQLERMGDGQFNVTWDAETRTLSWEDNGIGMSAETADQKFLSLGDTSKIATMSNRDMQRGGFGIAKAILLGASSTFTWTLHTRNRIFTSSGFDSEVTIHAARPRQGTKLTVVGIAQKHVGNYSSWSEEYALILPRLVMFLASCKAPFPIRFNGELVEPAFMGPGVVIAEAAKWGEGVTGVVRSYQRTEMGGCLYLRLGGLTQFWTKIGGGKATVDVIVDLDTKIRPTERGYPLTASRMALSGPAETAFKALLEELNVDVLSATTSTKAELVEDAPDKNRFDLNQAQLRLLGNAADNDPVLRAMLDAIPGLRTAMTRARRSEEEDQPPPPQAQQQSKSSAGKIARAFQEMAANAAAETPPEPEDDVAKRQQIERERRQAAAEKERLRKEELRGRGFSNPFAGAGFLKVNRGQWSVERLRPYLDKPEAILPILFLWRAALALVAAETHVKGRSFTVGFIFDDKVRAEYAGNGHLFSLNPVPVVKLYQELPSNPEIIAAYLHNKACHEMTHRLGYGYHDEQFVAARESLADRTAGSLAPLTRMVALVLGMVDRMADRMTDRKLATKPAPRVPRIPFQNGRVESASMPAFLAGVASLLTHAGYPATVRSDDGYYQDQIDATGINERVEDEEGIAITIRKSYYDPTTVAFDGKRWTTFTPGRFLLLDLLTATEKKVDDQRSAQVLDLAQRVARKLVQEFRKGEIRPLTPTERAGREGGSANHGFTSGARWTPELRRRTVMRGEAVLARRAR